VSTRLKELRINLEMIFDVLFGEDGLARRDSPDQRQSELLPQRVL
jgi:hypothetical protein